METQWKKIGIQPHHGINIALFSLYSRNSWGIGEFPDLIPLIDWVVEVGFDLIQLLPLNDTGMDASPYAALSASALHPIYLGLSTLPYVNTSPLLQEKLHSLRPACSTSRVEYQKILSAKEVFLNLYFDCFQEQLIQRQEVHAFMNEASYWLETYVYFKILKKRFNYTSWENWPNPISTPLSQEEECAKIRLILTQYLLDLQLKNVKNHAKEKGILLMGDLPILLQRDSVDVWAYPALFDLTLSAGSPPDPFDREGQNWGFPIYNWKEMERTGFRWWIERLKTASRYSDLYRIDHIVGFFRIWAIPHQGTTQEGRFYPENPSVWIDHGTTILAALTHSSPMLPIGEDLGSVPPEVKKALHDLGICGTKVMRWERFWDEDEAFIPIDAYPEDSLTTVSTHDTETLGGWWRDYPLEAKQLALSKGWSYHPILNPSLRQELLWDSHHTSSLFHVNLLQEYLALIPELSWPDPDLDRINTPGYVSEHNWSYRLRSSLEEFTTNSSLANAIKEIL